jgi:uncharacterized protein with HEPN domain
MSRDDATLVDIARSLRLIIEFTGTMNQIGFLEDSKTQSYDSVDLDEVWSTAARDVPRLLALMDPLLPSSVS